MVRIQFVFPWYDPSRLTGRTKTKSKTTKSTSSITFCIYPPSQFIFQKLLLQSLTLVTLTVECVITNTEIWPVVLSSALCFALIWVWPFVVDWAQYIRYLTHLLHPHNFTPLHHQWDRGNHRQSLAGIFSHIPLCVYPQTHSTAVNTLLGDSTPTLLNMLHNEHCNAPRGAQRTDSGS